MTITRQLKHSFLLRLLHRAPPMPWHAWLTLSPVPFGAGILLFLTPAPDIALTLLCIATTGLSLLAWQYRDVYVQLACTAMLCLCGMLHATCYTHYHHAPMISERYFNVPISASVEEVIRKPSGVKLVLADSRSEAFTSHDTNVTLRLSARSQATHVRAGDIIEASATIFPPSRPSSPYGFDFRRYFFTQSIGGVGYIIGDITIIEHAPDSVKIYDDGYAWVQRQRMRIEAALLRDYPQPAASIAAALSIGARDAIPGDARDALQQSSLAHMLAISGMHIGIVCGLIFTGLRTLLACIPSITLRVSIKHIAAAVALLGGAGYLMLADFPLSAMRAYAMIALLLLAVLCSRAAQSRRSLALAAWIVMLLYPLSVASASFQLSFSATCALIWVYYRLSGWWVQAKPDAQWWQRGLYYIAAIAMTSFVASIATAPLLAYHFHRVPLYGILANVMALPILTVIVAPALLAAALLWTIDLHEPALALAVIGIDGIMWVAHHISNLPFSDTAAPALSPLMVIVIMLSLFVGLYLRRWWYYVVLCSIITLTIYGITALRTLPDIIIAEDRSAIAVRTPQHWILLKGSARNFQAKQWQQALDMPFVTYKQAEKNDALHGWLCGDAWCHGSVQQRSVRFGLDYKTEESLCPRPYDIIITSFYSDRWACDHPPKVRINRTALERYGTHMVWAGSTIRHWRACDGSHPWHRWAGCLLSE